MTKEEAKKILDSIVGQVFGYQNPLSLEQWVEKFTFDVRLPQPVQDATDGSQTWATSTNPTKFIEMNKARVISDATDGLQPKRPINNLQELLAVWNEVNYTTTERQIESINVAESDDIRHSENILHSQNIDKSKNILYSDGLMDCESVFASQRSHACTNSIRVDDSNTCSNSFGITWCAKISNCLFMNDCGDMQDSMFCTNIGGKRFCVANMQFEEAEYRKLREEVVRWILSPT